MQHKKKSLFKKSGSAGFTMLEMLTVLAIFGIVSAVVLFNHGKFTSETILTNMAYEVALSIREAQIYGVSVRGDSADFDAPYGIHIPAITTGSELTEYILFRDSNPTNNRFDGNCINNTECVTPYTFQRNIFIENTAIEIMEDGDTNCPPGQQDRGLNIIFNRPNPEPVITTSSDIDEPVTRAQITLQSRDGAERFVVISNNGQISVENESICTRRR